jgi:hypothetical protein
MYFDDTIALAKLPHYIIRVIQKVIEINMHENFRR